MAPRKGDRVISLAEVATKMGVQSKAVGAARRKDPDFPSPVTPDWQRSPGFSEAQIDRYIKIRAAKALGRPGRKPGASSDRVQLPAEVNAKLAELIRQRSSVAAVADLFAVSPAAVWFRLQGKSRWRRVELEELGRLFAMSYEDLVAPPAPARPRRTRKSAPATRGTRRAPAEGE